MNRRAMLKSVAVAGTAAALPLSLLGQAREGSKRREATLRYLEQLARPGGGYGLEGQEHPHLTPTFYVVGSYRVLGQTAPKKDQLAVFIRTHHPSALKKLEQERRIFEFQQTQALAWLGEDASVAK